MGNAVQQNGRIFLDVKFCVSECTQDVDMSQRGSRAFGREPDRFFLREVVTFSDLAES